MFIFVGNDFILDKILIDKISYIEISLFSKNWTWNM